MKLSELLAELGDDNLKFQTLHETASGARVCKGGTEISFMTTTPLEAVMPIHPFLKPTKVGLVVWVDASIWDATVARLKEGGKL